VALVPLHQLTLLAVLTTMTVWAVVTHLGVNPLPVGWAPHGLSRWLIGPTHHGLHHRHSDRHFGLYFTFWDRLCGTEDQA
jgi:sterol desaturase/sphingolipid hydroxylase (fatty acid hydroxylase superfamily)